MATPTRRTPRLAAELRREQLLDAALDVLCERGLGGLTIDAVALRAGITRPVVYSAFGDLQGLLLALLDRAQRTALGPLLAIVDVSPGEEVDPERFLAESVLRFLRAVRADPRTWRLVLTPPRGSSPLLRERIAASRQLVADHVRTLLDWGVPCRGGPLGLDHELAARLIVAAGEDAARLMLAHPGRFTPELFSQLTAELVALLPRGRVGADGAPPAALGAAAGRGAQVWGGAQASTGPGASTALGACTAAGAVAQARSPSAVDPGPPVPAPSGARRRVPQAQRREQLLDVGLALLAEEGFGALSMEAIARRAGVNRVIVYRSFANLHVLLAALLRREDRRIMRTLARVIPQVDERRAEPAAARLLGGALADFLAAVLASPQRWRVALLRPECAPPALQKLVNRRRAALARRLEPLVALALEAAGAEVARLDTEALARLALSVCEEQARLALDDPRFPPRRLLSASLALLEALPGPGARR